MKRFMQTALTLVLGLALVDGSVYARGFGGFGGFHAGGFHAGGLGAGGFHAGGLGAGGFRAGGLGAGGFRAGGFDAGGFHAGDVGGFQAGGLDAGGLHVGGAGGLGVSGFHAGGFDAGAEGGSLSRGKLNSFLGLPTDAGMHAAGGAFAGRGAVAGPEGAAAWRGGAAGNVYQGPRGTTIAHGTVAGRGAAVGPGGAVAGGGVASGTAVEGPRGNVYTHDTTAARGIAAGPEGVAAGREFSSGTAVRGAGGTTIARGVSGAQGVVAGREGGVVAGGGVARGWGLAAGGVRYVSPTYMRSTGVAVRAAFPARNVFTRGWYTAHPGAWYAAGLATGVWAGATWAGLNDWFGTDWAANPYDYGENITYVNNNVYYGGQLMASAEEYAQAADELADQGQADVAADAQWLPLGVFALLEPGQKTATMTVQLAVDKQGIVRGNYYNLTDKKALPIQGAVNKSTQQIAWTIGDNKNMVLDTGLYNLTEDETTVLVHDGTGKTSQWMMIRLKQQDQSGGGQPETQQ